jgi:hypothetical protein
MEPSGPTYGERVGQGGPLVWPPSCRRKFACRDAGDATSLAVASDGRSRCFAEVRDDGVGSPDVAELGPSHLATKRSAAGKPTVREAQADPKPPVGLPQSCPRPSLAFSRFASTKQPLVIYGSRPTAAGRQPDEILSAAVVSTNKKPRCLSGAFVRRCPLPLPRSCQTSETERGEGARIGGRTRSGPITATAHRRTAGPWQTGCLPIRTPARGIGTGVAARSGSAVGQKSDAVCVLDRSAHTWGTWAARRLSRVPFAAATVRRKPR